MICRYALTVNDCLASLAHWLAEKNVQMPAFYKCRGQAKERIYEDVECLRYLSVVTYLFRLCCTVDIIVIGLFIELHIALRTTLLIGLHACR